MLKFDILNNFSGEVQLTAKIKAGSNDPYSVKMGLAIRWAISNKKNLTRANLTGANLTGADLSRADLTGADLTGANLTGADLTGANLSRADLSRANLTGADLSRADLTGANLSRADLTGTIGCELAIARTRILPDGDIIGWKKCGCGVIVKLLIPKEAKRSHAFGRKCRAEFAKVLEVFGGAYGVSMHDRKTTYRLGETVVPNSFDESWVEECSTGIHFYISRIEAENHNQ